MKKPSLNSQRLAKMKKYLDFQEKNKTGKVINAFLAGGRIFMADFAHYTENYTGGYERRDYEMNLNATEIFFPEEKAISGIVIGLWDDEHFRILFQRQGKSCEIIVGARDVIWT